MHGVDCDVIILGCGPAGFSAAASCAAAGYDTVVIEREKPGGTGYRWGCLPVKAMIDAVDRISGAASLVGELSPGKGSPDLGTLGPGITRGAFERAAAFSDRLPERLETAGIRYMTGDPEFISPRACAVGGAVVRGAFVILATGTDPANLEGGLSSGKRILSHRDIFHMDTFPRSLIIVGGDVEGIEFASFFSAVGTKVDILEQADRILPGTDEDLTVPVIRRLVASGTGIHTGTTVLGVDETGTSTRVEARGGGVMEADAVLITGRRKLNVPRGLKELGLETGEGRIIVDERLETTIPGVFALGDANGTLPMAHEALRQGALVPGVLAGSLPGLPGIEGFPRAVFCLPGIAGAGLREMDCISAGIPCERVEVPFRDIPRAAAAGNTEGFIKVLFGAEGNILGIWGVGGNIAETASSWSFLPGTSVEIDSGLVIHPTVQEGVKEAVSRFKLKHRLLRQHPPA